MCQTNSDTLKEPDYRCLDCGLVLPRTKALNHGLEKQHDIKKLDEEKDLTV